MPKGPSEKFVTNIKPHLEKFMKHVSKENVNILLEKILNLDSTDIPPHIQNYFIIPLIIKLDEINGINSAEIKYSIIRIIDHILSNIYLNQIAALKTILVVALKQIYDFEQGLFDSKSSEELKLAVMKLIQTSFQRSTSDVISDFYVKENSPVIGKISVCCVEIIINEKYRLLRKESLKCLMTVFYVHDSADFDDIVLRHQVAGIVFVFLPKIVKTLFDVINGDAKQGESLILYAIRCLARILNLIFEDYSKTSSGNLIDTNDFINLIHSKPSNQFVLSDDEILANNIKSLSIEERSKKLSILERTNDWLSASSRKIKPIIVCLNVLRGHTSNLVRLEYVEMCTNILKNCAKHLKECIPIFLESTIALSQDETCEIAEKCRVCIKLLETKNNTALLTECERLFEMCIMRLPRIIYKRNSLEQISEFLFLRGVFDLLPGDNLKIILSSGQNLHLLCMCFVTACEIDLTNILLNEEYAIKPYITNEIFYRTVCWQKFKNIEDDKTLRIMKDTLSTLGKSSGSDIVIDKLMDMLRENEYISNEIFLIFQYILCCNVSNTNRDRVILNICNELIKEDHWHLSLFPVRKQISSSEDNNAYWYRDQTPGIYESAIEIRKQNLRFDDFINDDTEDLTMEDVKFNILHTCIVLEVIGNFALTLKEVFRALIFNTLHKVLQKSVSSNVVIYETATCTLLNISKCFGYNDIPGLINGFSNYISFHINVELKKVDVDESAFEMLSALLKFSSVDSLVYIENILETIINQCTQIEHGNEVAFLKIFHIFLITVKKWLDTENVFNIVSPVSEELKPKNRIYDRWLEIIEKENDKNILEQQMNENTHKVNGENFNMDIENELGNHNKSSDESEENEDNDNNKANCDIPDNDETLKKQYPKHINLVIKILKIILKFICSKEQAQKVMSLECATIGLPLLKEYEDELLPTVHLIWYPLTERFKDKDPIVLHRCFTLLEVLAINAKDFLLQRSLKDVIPHLNNFLRKSSKNKETGIAQTQEEKLQIKLFQQYPNIIASLEITGREFDDILESVSLYLHTSQRHFLQEKAIEFFKQLIIYDSPSVYIKLTEMCNNSKDNTENLRKCLEFFT